MRVLVVYASRYGATQGIAERIAAILRQQGLEAIAQPAQQASDPAAFDAVVIGSAVYYFHWLWKAKWFVRRNRDALATRPVWLFSSGPLGAALRDAQGRDLCEVLRPREIAKFDQAIHPREHRVFFGALKPDKLRLPHKLLSKLPANRDNALFPVGDFRDWLEIEAWARDIARALKAQAKDTSLSRTAAA